MLNILIFGHKLIKFFKFFKYLWYFLCKFFNQKVMALQKYTLLGRLFHSCHYNYYCHYCPYVAMSVCHIRRSSSVAPPPNCHRCYQFFFYCISLGLPICFFKVSLSFNFLTVFTISHCFY